MLGRVTPQPATSNLNPGVAVKLAPPPSSASAETAQERSETSAKAGTRQQGGQEKSPEMSTEGSGRRFQNGEPPENRPQDDGSRRSAEPGRSSDEVKRGDPEAELQSRQDLLN